MHAIINDIVSVLWLDILFAIPITLFILYRAKSEGYAMILIKSTIIFFVSIFAVIGIKLFTSLSKIPSDGFFFNIKGWLEKIKVILYYVNLIFSIISAYAAILSLLLILFCGIHKKIENDED